MTDTVTLHHVVAGPAAAPPVLLGASLGTTHALWDDLAADLARDHRVVRFDTRGHGGSPAPAGPYTVEGLTADVVAVADELGLDRFAYVGLSLGGAIGQRMAIDHGERLSSLVLCCTGPVFGSPAMWAERAAQVREHGMDVLVEPTTERWFTSRFRVEHPDRVTWVMDMFRATPPDGYVGCCDAMAAFDVTDELAAVEVPTLVVAGAQDPTCPPSVGTAMVESIPDARLEVVEEAAHIANVAQPGAVARVVRAHLEGTST
jgi:3-oxoadipate enol-lactonase